MELSSSDSDSDTEEIQRNEARERHRVSMKKVYQKKAILRVNKVYQNEEQRELARRVADLQAIGDEDALIQQEQISMQLANWIRMNYPHSFRVFEIKDSDYEKIITHLNFSSLNIFKSMRLQKNQRVVEELRRLAVEYGLKQDDIVIFHPSTNDSKTIILYFRDNRVVSSSAFLDKKPILPTMFNEMLEKLGLTKRAAQQLYFPHGGYPLFSLNERL